MKQANNSSVTIPVKYSRPDGAVDFYHLQSVVGDPTGLVLFVLPDGRVIGIDDESVHLYKNADSVSDGSNSIQSFNL